MNALKQIVVLAGVGLLAFFPITTAAEPNFTEAEAGISVEAQVHEGAAGDYSIDFKLTNNTGTVLSLLEDAMPWKSTLNSSVILVPFDPRFEGALYPPKSDLPTATRIVLRPGQTLAGKLPLKRYFRNIKDILAVRDAGLFWWWELSGVEKDLPSQVFCGHFLLRSTQPKIGTSKQKP